MRDKILKIVVESDDEALIEQSQIATKNPPHEIQKLFEDQMNHYLKNFEITKKFFGLYKSYGWINSTPKKTIRMFLFEFDGTHGTEFTNCIFGEQSCPDFLIKNKELSEKLFYAICCDPSFNIGDFDSFIERSDILRDKLSL